jgi:hypothetical protein
MTWLSLVGRTPWSARDALVPRKPTPHQSFPELILAGKSDSDLVSKARRSLSAPMTAAPAAKYAGSKLLRAPFAPVLKNQRSQDPLAVPSVICHQHRAGGQRVPRDHHVDFTNRSARYHKLMPDFRVEIRRLGAPGEHPDKMQPLEV